MTVLPFTTEIVIQQSRGTAVTPRIANNGRRVRFADVKYLELFVFHFLIVHAVHATMTIGSPISPTPVVPSQP